MKMGAVEYSTDAAVVAPRRLFTAASIAVPHVTITIALLIISQIFHCHRPRVCVERDEMNIRVKTHAR